MTFHSYTSEDIKSPIRSEGSFGDIESPQLVTQSVEGLGESYVVIAGSKPLSIIIKKCILPNSISEYSSFASSEHLIDNGRNQLSLEEERHSEHRLEIACVSSEEPIAPCFKSAELHLDSISRTINECSSIADGSAICEIDCGLVNVVCSQNSDCRSDAPCSQQDENRVSVCGVNEFDVKSNIIIEPESSSAYTATENSTSNAYEELEAETNAETVCTSESEVYVRSDVKDVITEPHSKVTGIHMRSKENVLYGNVEAILLDENAVSSLSPSFTFYGTVNGTSGVAVSQDIINDGDVLHDTNISSAGSPASPVLGSASKVQRGTRTKKRENNRHVKIKCIEKFHNAASCDSVVCSPHRNVSPYSSKEDEGMGEHSSKGEADQQSLPPDRRNFIEIGALSLERQKMLNVLEDGSQETDTSVYDAQGGQTGVSDGCVKWQNVRKNDETICHQNIVNFSAVSKILSPSKSCSGSSLLLKNCILNSTRLPEAEKFSESNICSNTVPGVNAKSAVENLCQEEQEFLPNAKEIKTTLSDVCLTPIIPSTHNSVCVNNVCNKISEADRIADHSVSKSLMGEHERQLYIDSDYVHETQDISSNKTSGIVCKSSPNGCLKQVYDKNQSSQDKFDDAKVPIEGHKQLDSRLHQEKLAQNLLGNMLCHSSVVVPNQGHKEPSEKSNNPYFQDTEESCSRSDSVFEDFCFDSVKEFDNEYFDQFLDSPVIDTSKVSDKSRYLSVCDNSLSDAKGDHVRNDLHVDVGDNVLQEPNFVHPDSVTIERTSNVASQIENSPLLFGSDDESSDSQWENTQTTLKENKSPLRDVTPVTTQSTIIEALHKKLQKIQELLLGIPPPPSITMPNHTLEEMLRLIKQNEHLMVQKSFTNSGNMQESHGLKRKSHALRDVLNTSWPQIKDCDYFDIQYNHGAVSEELDRQYQRLQERFVGRETASSCNPWFTTWNSNKSSVRYQRSLGQSPGSRLSHLARRRQSFSSSNLQPASISGKLPGAIHRSAIERRVIMVDAKKEEKQLKHKINNRRLQRNTICMGEDDNRLRSSRRALFQSPVDDKKVSSYLKPRAESHNMKTDAWGGTSKRTENRGRSLNENFNVNGKRVMMSDSQSHPRKISRRLVFDASQAAGHSLSLNTEFNRYSSVSSQPTEKKSNSSYVNGNHRSQVHTQPLSSSQPASKSRISGTYKKKLLWAVAEALRMKGITMNHHLFHPCASSLTRLLLRVVGNTLLVQSREDSCKTTSEELLETALQHVHTVVPKTEAGCS